MLVADAPKIVKTIVNPRHIRPTEKNKDFFFKKMFSIDVPARNEKYTGIRGSMHGEKNETMPPIKPENTPAISG